MLKTKIGRNEKQKWKTWKNQLARITNTIFDS